MAQAAQALYVRINSVRSLQQVGIYHFYRGGYTSEAVEEEAHEEVSTGKKAALSRAGCLELGALEMEESSRLGDVVVEVEVGIVRKRTSTFRVMGEPEVAVHQTVIMPTPEEGQPLKLRVIRLGRLKVETAVGEARVVPALDKTLQVNLAKGGAKAGSVVVHFSLADVTAAPVWDGREKDAAVPHQIFKDMAELRNKVSDQVFGARKSHKSRGPSNTSPDDILQSHSRPSEALLQSEYGIAAEGDPFDDCAAECEVTIESVTDMGHKVGKPLFVLRVGDREFVADRLAHKAATELTFRFPVQQLRSDLQVFCYDEYAKDRHTVLGRILIPLADLVWGPDRMPGCATLMSSRQSGYTAEKFYVARFMPAPAGGAHIDSMFQAIVNTSGKGFPRSQVFGFVGLRIKLTLRTSQLSYFWRRKALPDSGGDAALAEDNLEAESCADDESLLNVVRKVNTKRIERNVARLIKLIIPLQTGKLDGIVRWMKGSRVHGVVSAIAWFTWCISGYFPPPAWSLPLILWSVVLCNGLLIAHQRSTDWAAVDAPPYRAWGGGEVKNKLPTPLKQQLMDAMNQLKSRISELEQNTDNLAGVCERFLNLFSFVDGVATSVFYAFTGVITLVLTALSYIWFTYAPNEWWLCGLVGSGMCLYLGYGKTGQGRKIAKKEKAKKGYAKPEDAVTQVLDRAHGFLSIVPDGEYLAHHYIATKLQCPAMLLTLKVTVISAKRLRNADWLVWDPSDVSDPYCICEVPGKPFTKFQTAVVKDNLNPEWDCSSVIHNFEADDTLRFSVWDEDVGKNDDSLGTAVLTSSQVYPRGFDGDLPLNDVNAKEGDATLKVRVEVLR